MSFFLNVFVDGTLFPLSPGWTSLAHLSSLLSQIRFSIPSLSFSAFSCSLSGLKPSFRNTGDQNNMQPSRPGHRKAFSQTFPFFLQKVYLRLSPWARLSSLGETHLLQTRERRGQLQQLAHEMVVIMQLSRGPSFLSLCCLIVIFQGWLRPIGTAGLAPTLPHSQMCEAQLGLAWALCHSRIYYTSQGTLEPVEYAVYYVHCCDSLFLRTWKLLISYTF